MLCLCHPYAQHTELPDDPCLFLVLFCSPAIFDFAWKKRTAKPRSQYQNHCKGCLGHRHRFSYVPQTPGVRSAYCLFPQTPGACSACLAHAPGGAPVQSHRSAAASLSPPNVCSTPEQGTFHNQRRWRVGHSAQGVRSWGGPLGPTGSDGDPAAHAALAKRAERVPAHEAKRQNKQTNKTEIRIRRPVSRVL